MRSLQQAIQELLDFTRWELAEALLKADILVALTTIITGTTTPLFLCSTATKVAALLGSWEHVQLLPDGIGHLKQYAYAICTLLLTSLTNSASSISLELDIREAPTWVNECINFDEIDIATTTAVDTLNLLYPLCDDATQQNILKLIDRIGRAGALTHSCGSLQAAVRFRARRFGLIVRDHSSSKALPPCPTTSSLNPGKCIWDACMLMTWTATEHVRHRGLELFLSILWMNRCMWTSHTLDLCLKPCIADIYMRWPSICEQYSMKQWCRRSVVMQGVESDAVFAGTFHIMKPHSIRPWNQGSTDIWSSTKESLELESMVMLEAIKAGALRMAMHTYSCNVVHRHQFGTLEFLTGSSPRGLIALTNLRDNGSWSSIFNTLVEAAQQLMEIALAQQHNMGSEIDEGDAADGTEASKSDLDPDLQDALGGWFPQNPWLDYSLSEACAFVAEVSTLHQRELEEFRPPPSLTRSVSVDAQPPLAEQASLQSLYCTIHEAVAGITQLMEDGAVASAVLAAPAISALLGVRMLSTTALTFNADLLFESRAIPNICLHLHIFSSTGDEKDVKALMVVPLLLAQRNPEARMRLIQAINVPSMLRRAISAPWYTQHVLTFLCSVLRSYGVDEVVKNAPVLEFMRHVCKVRHILGCGDVLGQSLLHLLNTSCAMHSLSELIINVNILV